MKWLLLVVIGKLSIEYFHDRTKVSGPSGDPIADVLNNYQGVQGLTVTNYYIDQSYPGQMVMDLSYTSPHTKGGNWTQWVKLKSEYSTQSFWDNGMRGEGNSTFYYTDSEINGHTFGNTITFHDNPYFSRTMSFYAELSLRTPSEAIILTLNYGFNYRIGVQYPMTLYPLNVTYHKY